MSKLLDRIIFHFVYKEQFTDESKYDLKQQFPTFIRPHQPLRLKKNATHHA